MAEMNVITSMLDDLTQEQPVSTALCIGQHLEQYDHHQTIQWQYFNVTTLLNLPLPSVLIWLLYYSILKKWQI